MTQKEKFILLQDLSARLPYGVIVDIKYNKEHGSSDRLRICSEGSLTLNTDLMGLCIEEEIYLKPYLRPMSSMTEEEKKEFHKLKQFSVTVVMPNGVSLLKPTYIVDLEDDGDGMNYLYDWLNAHHFDYRGLIEKGLALKAPEGMYNTKEK